MKEIIKYNELLDLYSTLLTQKQVQYLTLYFFEDYSFNEIADKYKITKAAVYDSINKAKKQLIFWESKLNLQYKKEQRNNLYSEITDVKLKKKLKSLEEKKI